MFFFKVSEPVDSLLQGVSLLSEETDSRIYYDTFDWKLFKENLLLYHQNKYLFLVRLEDESPCCGTPLNRINFPFFWRILPEGALKQELERITGHRALIPRHLIQCFTGIYSHTDKSSLSEGVVCVKKFIFPSNRQEPELELPEGYRFDGFDKGGGYSFVGLSPGMNLSGLPSGSTPLSRKEMFGEVMRWGRFSPGEYSSKPHIPLLREESAARAFNRIFLSLLDLMEDNIPGIIGDLDSDFLHDFRVACRQIRTLSGTGKLILPDSVREAIKEDFKLIGNNTGHLRDADVYLLKREEYISLLPDNLKEGLYPFFTDLAEKRRDDLHYVRQFFVEGGYRSITEPWRKYFHEFQGAESPSLEELVLPVLRKRLVCILQKGGEISFDSPYDDYHCLRIEFKKIRYLFSFFRALFPEDLVQNLELQFKGIQDLLGVLNDLHIQQSYLSSYLEGLSGSGALLRAAALGGLIARLHAQGEMEKVRFAELFEQFRGRENLVLFSELLGVGL